MDAPKVHRRVGGIERGFERVNILRRIRYRLEINGSRGRLCLRLLSSGLKTNFTIALRAKIRGNGPYRIPDNVSAVDFSDRILKCPATRERKRDAVLSVKKLSGRTENVITVPENPAWFASRVQKKLRIVDAKQ